VKILMPQLGETVNEGTVSAWYKKPGDMIEKDETLLDVETDKVATEIPSPAAGILKQIMVPEGDTVDVGTVLAIIGDGDDEEAEAETTQEISKEKIETIAAVPVTAARISSHPGAGPGLSPAVRRLAAQHQLNLDDIAGTGRDGRIRKQDVLAFIETLGTGGSDAATTVQADRIPFDRIRRVTAEHMVRSRATSAHVLQAIEADFSAVDSVRLANKTRWKEKHGFSLSYLPFIARAVCRAIESFPRINSSVEDQALQIHSFINLAIAVDLNHEGLVAPVIKNAADLSVPELAIQINRMAGKARQNTLGTDDLSGGTYTISNPGPFGTLFTAPIINQPQVAILSTDAVQKKPVVIEDPAGDMIAIRPVGVLAQSFDHRAIDGAYSAAFLARVKQLIEDEDWSKEFDP
jgi:pyruvate dehydrogenase E2 component (dihydrolipoamide acetyltransferase)